MKRYENAAINSATGLPIPSPSVTVFHAGSGVQATIYSDEGVTIITQPLVGDTIGRFKFYAPDGDYDIQIAGAGVTSYTIQDVTIADTKRLVSVSVLDQDAQILANAFYNRQTSAYNRRNTANAAWRIELDVPNSLFAVHRVAAGANPITWAELLQLQFVSGHTVFRLRAPAGGNQFSVWEAQGAAVDNRRWRWQNNGTTLGLEVTNDAENAADTVVAFDRVGATGTGFRVQGNALLRLIRTANAQTLSMDSVTELTTIAAAAFTDTAITLPANALITGVSVRVVTVIPTAATFDVGVVGATTRYMSGLSTAAGTTSASVGDGTAFRYGAATAVRITPNLTPATATGQVRVTIHFIVLTGPTS